MAQPIVVLEVEFADRLRMARQYYGGLTRQRMTQARFAELLGEDEKKYENWEAGYNRPRDIVAIARKVEDLTGISASWLLTGDHVEGALRLSRERNDAGQEPFSCSDMDALLDAVEQQHAAAVA